MVLDIGLNTFASALAERRNERNDMRIGMELEFRMPKPMHFTGIFCNSNIFFNLALRFHRMFILLEMHFFLTWLLCTPLKY
jgi:hypothetical protein